MTPFRFAPETSTDFEVRRRRRVNSGAFGRFPVRRPLLPPRPGLRPRPHFPSFIPSFPWPLPPLVSPEPPAPPENTTPPTTDAPASGVPAQTRPNSPDLFSATMPAATRPTQYFKDNPTLQQAALTPLASVTTDATWTLARKQLAETFNRVGGLIGEVARLTGTEVPAALAVWAVESGGRRHVRGRAIIRFENHKLFALWGANNQADYDRHFQHGGRGGISGRGWENHTFRDGPSGSFRPFHGNQDLEYRVLSLAMKLAGSDTAVQCISIGGPQILVSNFRLIGYDTAKSMFDAFQASERAHVLGFFDYCRHRAAPKRNDLLQHLKNKRWAEFARYYNGPGQVEKYSGRLSNAYDHARAIGV
jgi:hypothetical protein